jgi:large subunit ribosomal protein L18
MRMAISSMKFRRRREAVTDYKKRLGIVKSGLDRVVVRKTNKRIIGQIVRYGTGGDIVLAHADSGELAGFKWPSRPNRLTAYLTGLLLAKKAGKHAHGDHILDIGIASPVAGSVPFVFAKGCIDGGMKLRGTLKIDEKSYGTAASRYASELKSKDSAKYGRLFSAYIKAGFAPENLGSEFNSVKDKIMKKE